MHKKIFLSILIVFAALRIYAQENITAFTHSFISELEEFLDVGNLPAYRSGSEVIQVSSYDRSGDNDDGFSGKYSYIRRNADSTLVIFEAKGDGVINRIWTPTPNNDTLDFYIGDTSKVSFSIKFSDIFSGEVYPFVMPLCGNQLGGFYSYIPINFEGGCKIVSRGKQIQFLQIQYRRYNDGESVKDFNLDLNPSEKEALSDVSSFWEGDWNMETMISDSNKLLLKKSSVELKPGETQTIFNTEKGGRIMGIEIDNAALFEGSYNDVDIRISWDDENIPAIYTPIADLFGYAFGNISMRSILLGSKDNTNYCYIPMPFDEGATIELIYRNGEREEVLHFNTRVYYSDQKRDKAKEGKLYVAWNRVLKSIEGKPLLFADVKGKGHYMGTVLQTQGLNPGMTLFFEGDDIAIVDGVNTIHGTGSEDYFNGGWYAFIDRWDTKVSLPIHGSLDYSLPSCRTGGYRFHISDKISFNESLHYSMEHGPVGNNVPVNNTSLGFYYCDTPKSDLVQPTNELSAIYYPEKLIIYPQLMSFDIWRDMDIRTEWGETGGFIYNFKVNNESRLRVSLKEIPHGKYKLYLDVNRNPEGCDVSLWQRQTKISEPISLFGLEKERLENLYVCDIEMDEFRNTLTFRFQTTPEKSVFSLNRLILVRD
jgi:hypothetical protein